MRVLCVDASTDATSELPVDLIEDSVYTVVDAVFMDGEPWYSLKEKGADHWYTADCFIPMTLILEGKFIRQYNKEKA